MRPGRRRTTWPGPRRREEPNPSSISSSRSLRVWDETPTQGLPPSMSRKVSSAVTSRRPAAASAAGSRRPYWESAPMARKAVETACSTRVIAGPYAEGWTAATTASLAAPPNTKSLSTSPTRPQRGDQAVDDCVPVRRKFSTTARAWTRSNAFRSSGSRVTSCMTSMSSPSPFQEPDVEIGGHHPARPDRRGQPGRDASRASTDLQATPARTDADHGQVPEGHRVEHRREAARPGPLLHRRLVEEVRSFLPDHDHHLPADSQLPKTGIHIAPVSEPRTAAHGRPACRRRNSTTVLVAPTAADPTPGRPAGSSPRRPRPDSAGRRPRGRRWSRRHAARRGIHDDRQRRSKGIGRNLDVVRAAQALPANPGRFRVGILLSARSGIGSWLGRSTGWNAISLAGSPATT